MELSSAPTKTIAPALLPPCGVVAYYAGERRHEMPSRLTDVEIESLLREVKRLPDNYRSRVVLRNKRGHKEREFDIVGDEGHRFRLILRQSNTNVLDFSIILALIPLDSNQHFRLRRYNGRSHEHSNVIEHQVFYAYHVHQATERYQDLGMREDSYAEPSDRYADYNSALRCMLEDCGFVAPPASGPVMFGEFGP